MRPLGSERARGGLERRVPPLALATRGCTIGKHPFSFRLKYSPPIKRTSQQIPAEGIQTRAAQRWSRSFGQVWENKRRRREGRNTASGGSWHTPCSTTSSR
jgi:hypothetical protein